MEGIIDSGILRRQHRIEVGVGALPSVQRDDERRIFPALVAIDAPIEKRPQHAATLTRAAIWRSHLALVVSLVLCHRRTYGDGFLIAHETVRATRVAP